MNAVFFCTPVRLSAHIELIGQKLFSATRRESKFFVAFFFSVRCKTRREKNKLFINRKKRKKMREKEKLFEYINAFCQLLKWRPLTDFVIFNYWTFTIHTYLHIVCVVKCIEAEWIKDSLSIRKLNNVSERILQNPLSVTRFVGSKLMQLLTTITTIHWSTVIIVAYYLFLIILEKNVWALFLNSF